MKRIIMTLMAGMLCAFMSTAQVKICNAPITMNIYDLSRYLDLNVSQIKKVEQINLHFIEAQKEIEKYKPEERMQKRYEVVHENLNMMKGVLKGKQYRDYLIAINLTNSLSLLSERAFNASGYVAGNE